MSDSTTEMDQIERDKLMSKAYTTAQSDLRKTHQDEFNTLYQKRCAELGIQWEPRKSKQEQALDQMLTCSASIRRWRRSWRRSWLQGLASRRAE